MVAGNHGPLSSDSCSETLIWYQLHFLKAVARYTGMFTGGAQDNPLPVSTVLSFLSCAIQHAWPGLNNRSVSLSAIGDGNSYGDEEVLSYLRTDRRVLEMWAKQSDSMRFCS